MIQTFKLPEGKTAFVFPVLSLALLHDSMPSSLTDRDTELRVGRLKKSPSGSPLRYT